jgi:hypothetical protein
MVVKAPGHATIERQVKRGLNALDEAVAMFRKNGQAAWADDIADVRDFIARSKAYYERLATKHTRHAPDARALAEVMWSEIGRKGK